MLLTRCNHVAAPRRRLAGASLDLDRLLERRAVDPAGARLLDGAKRPVDDRVVAVLKLVAVAAGLLDALCVVAVDLVGRRVRERVSQRAEERGSAALEVAAAAVASRVL